MPYYRCHITRDFYYDGDTSDIYVKSASPEQALRTIQACLNKRKVTWKRDGAFWKAGSPLDLAAYYNPVGKLSWNSEEDMQELVDIWLPESNILDCTIEIERITVVALAATSSGTPAPKKRKRRETTTSRTPKRQRVAGAFGR